MSDRLESDCSECGRKFKFTLEDVIQERTVRCGGGHSVKLKDDGRATAKAERDLRKIDPKFRFK